MNHERRHAAIRRILNQYPKCTAQEVRDRLSDYLPIDDIPSMAIIERDLAVLLSQASMDIAREHAATGLDSNMFIQGMLNQYGAMNSDDHAWQASISAVKKIYQDHGADIK